MLGLETAEPIGLAVLIAVAGAVLAVYARLLPDRHAVVLAVAAIALTAAAAGGRALDEAIGFTGSTVQSVASLALLVPWLLLVFLAAAAAVKRMRERIAATGAG